MCNDDQDFVKGRNVVINNAVYPGESKTFLLFPIALGVSFHSWEDANSFFEENERSNHGDMTYAAFKLGARKVSFETFNFTNFYATGYVLNFIGSLLSI